MWAGKPGWRKYNSISELCVGVSHISFSTNFKLSRTFQNEIMFSTVLGVDELLDNVLWVFQNPELTDWSQAENVP